MKSKISRNQQLKSQIETLVSTIADGAVLLDTDMQVILVNSTARRILAGTVVMW